jgi:hypothetical protein
MEVVEVVALVEVAKKAFLRLLLMVVVVILLRLILLHRLALILDLPLLVDHMDFLLAMDLVQLIFLEFHHHHPMFLIH